MAVSVVRTHLDDLTREMPAAAEARQLVGLAGTVTTVAAVELGLVEYDRDAVHHFRLTRAAAEDVFRTLATEPLEDRRHNPGLHPGRADIIVGGCCILVGILRHLDADHVLVSESDMLDGIARSLSG
jgi:exopolyphosphatase/guanosine-5'-triphosphate,3'-diphosphate pyrophosphatase